LRKRRLRIKTISVFFAVIAAVVLFYIATLLMKGVHSKSYDVKKIDAVDQNTFSDFSYKTYDAKGEEISLASDNVYEEKKDNYVFKNMTSTFALSNGEKCTVTADVTKAIRGDRTVCELNGHVMVTTTSGLLLQTEKSFVDFNNKISSGSEPITITGNNISLRSDKYYFDINENALTLIGNAKGLMMLASPNRNGGKLDSQGANGKCDRISSDKMIIKFDSKCKNSLKSLDATGNAKFTSDDYDLSAKEKIVYKIDRIHAKSDVKLQYRKNGQKIDVKSYQMDTLLDEKSSIREIIASGSLIIKTKDATIAADSGVFRENKVVALGNVVISNDQGNVLGDIAELDVLTGHVSVKKSSAIIDDSRGQ
jgi:LPS export ABC transporter protein LptC